MRLCRRKFLATVGAGTAAIAGVGGGILSFPLISDRGRKARAHLHPRYVVSHVRLDEG